MTEFQKEKIREIDDIASVSFNQEQKAIAKKIIENTPDSDLHEVFNFITQRVKLGFVFDEAPEVNHNAVSFVRENKNLNINITDLENTINVEHKLIIGENYDALKNLLVTHYEKIDVIYIDPPYNTEAMKGDGNDYKDEISANKFIYRDKFTRNGWLNMMNERLKLARKLLKETGVIFISIDDSEQAYLKVLCDEIFGEGNFVACIVWRKIEEDTSSGGTMKVTKTIRKDHEYILCYEKTRGSFLTKKYLELPNFKGNYKNLDNDPRGEFKAGSISMKGNKNSSKYYEVITPSGKSYSRVWRVTKEEFEALDKDNRIYYGKKLDAVPQIKIFLNEVRPVVPKSIFENLGSAFSAADDLDFLFNSNKRVFLNPKPTALLKRILEISTNTDSIILDFFAGSGTTAQAVMELNAEDNGRRECILVTNNENNIAINVTRERLYRVINGEGSNGEPIKWQYSEDKKSLENNSVRVFEVETHELSLNDLTKAENLANIAKGELKKLNPEYDINDELKIYSELASLNPQKDK